MILVTGAIDVDPAQRDAFIDAARTLMAATRAEEGCVSYSFAADLDDPGHFVLAEQWDAQSCMDAHMQQPHMAAFLGTVGGMVKASTITKWEGGTPTKLM